MRTFVPKQTAADMTRNDAASEGTAKAPANLGAVIGRLHRVAKGADRVTLGLLMDAMGPSSIAAVLLVPALLLVSPLSGIPGASVVGGVVISLISAQMLIGRQSVWLPDFIRSRSLSGPALRKALIWLRGPAKRLDDVAPARTGQGPVWWWPVLAGLCCVLGLGMPFLELIPFTSSIVAALVAALAMAMLTGRARFAVVAIGVAAMAIGLVLWIV